MQKPRVSDNDLIKDMTDVQLSRWIALYEAVNLIADNAEKLGANLNFMNMKKTPLDQYVDSTSTLIYRALTGKGMESDKNV